jgi:septum formation protein
VSGATPVSGARLILASRSPQRRAILTQLGVPFEVSVPTVEELVQGPPHELVLENAYRKAAAAAGGEASAVAGGEPGAGPAGKLPVLGVDTIVTLGTRIYGKPDDAEHARRMLTELSGRRHVVISGVCLIEQGRARTAAADTVVQFRTLDAPLIDWYVRAGEWRGRAGGYAIQERGAALVSRIEGDYLNVVGLPVATLLALAPGMIG